RRGEANFYKQFHTSTVSGLTGSRRETEEKGSADVVEKMKLFKQFDTVQGYSDHHIIHEPPTQSRHRGSNPRQFSKNGRSWRNQH
ncbi:hypothetical protein FRX31_021299, partial [Thalictrum thalictroides]